MKKTLAWLLACAMLLTCCGGAVAEAQGMTPGTYSASAAGFHGDI